MPTCLSFEPVCSGNSVHSINLSTAAYHNQAIFDILRFVYSDPLLLCQFLMESCQSRGVRLHQPAKAISITRSPSGTLSDITICNTITQEQTTIPCTRLVLVGHPFQAIIPPFFPSHLHVRTPFPPPKTYLLTPKGTYILTHEPIRQPEHGPHKSIAPSSPTPRRPYPSHP